MLVHLTANAGFLVKTRAIAHPFSNFDRSLPSLPHESIDGTGSIDGSGQHRFQLGRAPGTLAARCIRQSSQTPLSHRATPAEHEQVAVRRIALPRLLSRRLQTEATIAHIGVIGRKPHPFAQGDWDLVAGA
jgi:hypothetical protein